MDPQQNGGDLLDSCAGTMRSTAREAVDSRCSVSESCYQLWQCLRSCYATYELSRQLDSSCGTTEKLSFIDILQLSTGRHLDAASQTSAA